MLRIDSIGQVYSNLFINNLTPIFQSILAIYRLAISHNHHSKGIPVLTSNPLWVISRPPLRMTEMLIFLWSLVGLEPLTLHVWEVVISI